MGATSEELKFVLSGESKDAQRAASDFRESLNAAFEDPQTHVRGLADVVEGRLVTALGSGGAALGVVLATGAGLAVTLLGLTRAAADSGAEVLDFARKTDVAVENVGALRAAAKIAGTDLNTMGNAIFMMQKRMEDDSSGKFVKSLRDLNIDIQDFQAAKPDERLLMVSRALRDVGDGANTAATGSNIFGRGFKEMAPALMKDLDGLVAKARELGFSWSEEDVRAAEEFEESSRLLEMQLGRVESKIGKALLPIMADLTRSLANNQGVTDGVSAAAHALGVTLGWLVGFVGQAITSFYAIMAALDRTGEAIDNIGIVALRVVRMVFEAIGKIPGLGKISELAIGAIDGALGRLEANAATFDERMRNNIETGGKVFDTTQAMAAALSNVGTEQTKAADATDQHAAAHERLSKAQSLAKLQTEALAAAQVNRLDPAVRQTAEALFTAGFSAEEVYKKLIQAGLATEEDKKALELLHAATQKVIEKQKEQLKAIDDINRGQLEVAASDVIIIQNLHEKGIAEGEIVKALGLTEAQVKSVVEAEKVRDEISAQTHRLALEREKQFREEQQKQLDESNKAVVKNYDAAVAARQEYDDVIAKRTLTAYQYQQYQLEQWRQHQIAALDKTVPNWQSAAAEIERTFRERMEQSRLDNQQVMEEFVRAPSYWRQAWTNAIQSIPNLFTQAFTGGGGMTGAVKGLVSQFGSLVGQQMVDARNFGIPVAQGVSKLLGNAVGDVFGKMLPGIGALLGPALTGLFKLFGPSQEELQGRQVEAQFEKQFGSFEKMMAAVGDVYAATGRSALQAQADVAALLAAEKQGGDAAKAALAKINEAFDEQKQDAADLDAAIKRYGFSIGELGPTMQKQQLDAQAQQLLNDWRLLVGSGIDVSVVNQRMASSVQDYLKLAKQTGQEVPVAMQPILQKMIEQGTLTDENGNKITDMKQLGVSFSETMTQGFQKVVDKLDQLLQKIGMVPAALSAIPSSVDVDVNARVNWDTSRGPRDEEGHAAGGVFDRPHKAWIAEGGRPEIVGDVPFMSRALAGALDLLHGAAGQGLAAGAPAGALNLTVDARGAFFPDRAAVDRLAKLVGDSVTNQLRMSTQLGLRTA